MTYAKVVSTPYTTNKLLSIWSGETLVDPSLYRNIVSVLQYLMLTHLDIAYVVNIAYQFLHHPTTNHWQAMKHIICYLATIPI